MRPDHTQDDGACSFGKVQPTATSDNKLQHKPFLKCDEPEDSVPDEESQFGCPCCMNPWFR